jgi:tRNA A37 threonylcarbamoyladenosine dehydratase
MLNLQKRRKADRKMDVFSRSRLVLGDGAEKLKNCHVAVFGVGGVGSYTVEALARTGIGKISLFDSDTVSETNINRQLIALHSTVGKLKTEVAKERIKDINPDCEVFSYPVFFTAENESDFDFTKFDYVVDAIDTVSSKILLAKICTENNIPIISSMGTGNKLDPTKFEIADINKTSVCPLARVMRKELKARGIKKLKVLYSKEIPVSPKYNEQYETKGNMSRYAPGSVAFVPSVAGLIIAGEVIKDLCGNS